MKLFYSHAQCACVSFEFHSSLISATTSTNNSTKQRTNAHKSASICLMSAGARIESNRGEWRLEDENKSRNSPIWLDERFPGSFSVASRLEVSRPEVSRPEVSRPDVKA